jgi:hypothetical protein
MLEQLKTDRLIQLMLVAAVIVGGFACCIWGSALGYMSQNQAAPANAPQAIDTPVSAPTVPTPTEVELYRLKVAEKTTTMGQALQVLGSLLQNPRIGEEDWTAAAAASVVVIRSSYEEIARIKPPSEMLNIHSFVLDATRDCYRSMDFLVDGIDKRNIENINRAKELLLSCDEKLKRATQPMGQNQSAPASSPQSIDTPTIDIPAIDNTSTPIPAPTQVPAQPSSSACNCSGNLYNCGDFASPSDAQRCYESCPGDPHELDRDKDGYACEYSP